MLQQRSHFLFLSFKARFATAPILHGRSLKLTLDHPILSFLEACSNVEDLRRIHAKMITSGLIQDPFAASRLVKFCCLSTYADLDYARLVFTRIEEPDVFTWNILIKGYAQSDDPGRAILVYEQMRSRAVSPNEYTFPIVIKACSHVGGAREGAAVHGHATRAGFETVVEVQNSLIHMYSSCSLMGSACRVFDASSRLDVVSWNSMVGALAKNGDLDSARRLFDMMPERNVVSWNVMINGCVQCGSFKEALGLFDEMQRQNEKPNEPTLVNLVLACAHLGALDKGRQFHALIRKSKLTQNLVLLTALIDMCAKCGSIEDAQELFEKAPKRDLVMWNAMINGHAIHGDARRALELFSEMVGASVRPDGVTFVGVLTACSHVGLVNKGREYFDLMTQIYHISPEFEHYGCMVDLLGRMGCLFEAEELVRTMPVKTDASVWGALLNACRIHGNVEMGMRVGRILVELDPQNCGRYTLLYNMFADGGMWDEAARLRKMMRDRGIKKTRGTSSIHLNGGSHEFVAVDCSHPEFKSIAGVLNDLTEQLKLEGYVLCVVNEWLEVD
ncbi:pentatricopeptide repeat-containing protein At5g66520-like [Magnolia sinica]|uniref:pentatricopeptide repeat-containing protein At5g66520-like n=1 Tax=Magnolia sinica TaxID=86752 RepID=UPI002658AADF|nr:pentatricopeptide repeat-containing protein At5g66520-like [Magnolia sinica]